MSSNATSDLRLADVPLAVRIDRRARRLKLRLDRSGDRLVLTVPTAVSRRRALAWAASQEEWARGVLKNRPGRVAFAVGASFPFRGTDVMVRWRPDAPRLVRLEGEELHVGGAEESVAARVERWCRAEAKRLLDVETRLLATAAGVTIDAVSIGDPRGRWGSCSSRGRIRYSWRLVLAPDFVREAVVAHEVAHLSHMDHSPRFHAHLHALLGRDPAPANDWLRRHGAALHRIGGGTI